MKLLAGGGGTLARSMPQLVRLSGLEWSSYKGPVQAYAVVATAQHRDQGWGMTETNPMGSFGIRAARLIQHTVFFLIRSDVLRQENQSLNPNGPPWLVQIFTRE